MGIMRLPCDREALRQLTLGQKIAAIWVRRMFIRYHRDQVGDHRCFMDDWLVWQLLSDTPADELYTATSGMIQCRMFYGYRGADDVDTMPRGAILDPDRWDADLQTMSTARLYDELTGIQAAIRAHRDVIDRRSADDDRALYSILPEKLPADFRLPPESEFLGQDKAPHAGCPSFWGSHSSCETVRCNQHRWGPC